MKPRKKALLILVITMLVVTISSSLIYAAAERKTLNFSQDLFTYGEFETVEFMGGVSDGVSAYYQIPGDAVVSLKLTVWSYQDERTAQEQFAAVESNATPFRLEDGAEYGLLMEERGKHRSYESKISKRIKTAYKNFIVEMSLSFVSSGYQNYLDYKLTDEEKSRLNSECEKADEYMGVFEAKVISSLDQVSSYDENDSFFTGTVTDGKSHPLKNALINIVLDKGGKQTRLEGTTDSSGRYNIKTGIKPAEFTAANNMEAELCLYLTYQQDGIKYFNLVYGQEKDSPKGTMASFSPVKIMKNIALTSPRALKNDFVLDNQLDRTLYQVEPEIEAPEEISAVYFHMTEALEFYKDHLKANVAKDLPVEVMLYADGKPCYYTPVTTSIFISADAMPYNDPDRPYNREWHEFSHHVMYALYGSFPIGEYTDQEIEQITNGIGSREFSLLGYNRNHMGFLNSSTSDSLLEGFAEFMSLVIGKHYRYPRYDVYSEWGSLELNYLPNSSLGTDEEFAVAGILWDLVDSSADYTGADDDNVSLDFQLLWSVLSHYHRDFTSVYEELINVVAKDDAALKTNINEVFKRHNFFRENAAGNKRRDYWEPYIDTENKGRYDAGEVYLDFPETFSYDNNEKIGSPADAERTYRRNTAYRPGHFIKTGSPFPYFAVSVAFETVPHLNYSVRTKNADGLLYVNIPPGEYAAVITLKPASGKDESEFTFTSRDFYNNYRESVINGYYLESEFPAGEYATSNPTKPFAYDYDKFPSYAAVRDAVKSKEAFAEQVQSYQANLNLSNPKATARFPLPVIAGGCIACLIIAIVLRKKR